MATLAPHVHHVGITAPVRYEPGPIRPVTSWDRLVAAREDVLVAAMAEHASLTGAHATECELSTGWSTAEDVSAGLADVIRDRDLLAAAQRTEQAALEAWMQDIDCLLADLTEDPRYAEAEAMRDARSLADSEFGPGGAL